MKLVREAKEQILSGLKTGKVVIIYGARQVGKTTLVKQILSETPDSLYLNCDEPDVKEALEGKTSAEMFAFFRGAKLVAIDEAQRVKDIGISLKLLHDSYPELTVIATGSSSFDLANAASEPLTGRNYTIPMYPATWLEFANAAGSLHSKRLLEERILYGMYPAVINAADAQTEVKDLARDYLFKDVLQVEQIRRPVILEKLTQLLAWQIGNLVSYNEIAQKLQISRQTVISYVNMLEKAFILFRLPSLGNNPRSEVTRFEKIYFFDTGIRNALIGDFSPMEFRYDKGMLFENFFIAERMKAYRRHNKIIKPHFWRTKDGSEIDLVEREGTRIAAFECKWSESKINTRAWNNAFPEVPIQRVGKDNVIDFL